MYKVKKGQALKNSMFCFLGLLGFLSFSSIYGMELQDLLQKVQKELDVLQKMIKKLPAPPPSEEKEEAKEAEVKEEKKEATEEKKTEAETKEETRKVKEEEEVIPPPPPPMEEKKETKKKKAKVESGGAKRLPQAAITALDQQLKIKSDNVLISLIRSIEQFSRTKSIKELKEKIREVELSKNSKFIFSDTYEDPEVLITWLIGFIGQGKLTDVTTLQQIFNEWILEDKEEFWKKVEKDLQNIITNINKQKSESDNLLIAVIKSIAVHSRKVSFGILNNFRDFITKKIDALKGDKKFIHAGDFETLKNSINKWIDEVGELRESLSPKLDENRFKSDKIIVNKAHALGKIFAQFVFKNQSDFILSLYLELFNITVNILAAARYEKSKILEKGYSVDDETNSDKIFINELTTDKNLITNLNHLRVFSRYLKFSALQKDFESQGGIFKALEKDNKSFFDSDDNLKQYMFDPKKFTKEDRDKLKSFMGQEPSMEEVD